MKPVRWQVLWDGKNPGQPGGVQNARTKKEAELFKARLEAAGYRNVQVWDAQNNSFGEMFRL